MPSFIVGDKDKELAFAAASCFIQDVHRRRGHNDDALAVTSEGSKPLGNR